jgi:hypothetical protein
MGRLLTLAAMGAFSLSLLMAGSAGAVVCDPLCAPPKANANGDVRGLNRANAVAGEGHHGRDNAAVKQDLHKPGGSGVVQTPPPVPPAQVPPPVTLPPEPCVGC